MLTKNNKLFQFIVVISMIVLQIKNSEAHKPNFNIDVSKIERAFDFSNFLQINISSGCISDFYTIITSLKEDWVLKLFDSSAKSIPNGLLDGNGFVMGDYDECLNIQNDAIKGKYCIYTIQIKSINLSLANGICIPHKCSRDDINTIVKFVLNITAIGNLSTIEIKKNTCSTAEMFKFNESDWLIISIFVTLLLWILICTVLDCVNRKLTNNCIIFRAFSLYYNGERLFNINPVNGGNQNTISCLNGLRVLSIFWIIIDHRYYTTHVVPFFYMNTVAEKKYMHSLSATYITGGTLSVDTFLTISGCLLTYTLFKQLKKSNGKIPWLIFYLHRYVRLTVGLFVVLILILTVYRKLTSGPLWLFILNSFGLLDICSKYWWSQLLYVQNYVNPNNICLAHTWYLSVDMQLYMLSPLILYPMWRWKKFAFTIVPILFLALLTSTFLIVYHKGLKLTYMSPIESKMAKVFDFNKYYYCPTHTRAITWLMGVLLGYYIHNLKTPIKLKWNFVLFMWIVSLTLMLGMVMSIYPIIQDGYASEIPWEPIYLVFSRPLWSAGICWLIFACYTGYGGLINWILSLNAWIPLCRISYSVYLIHVLVQIYKLGSTRATIYFSPFNTFNEIFSDTVLTIFFATCLYLLFECPIFNLEIWFYKWKEAKKKAMNNESILTLSIQPKNST